MKSVIVVLLIVTLSAAISLRQAQNEFIRFQRKYNKIYTSEEFGKRFQIFRANLEKAELLQERNPRARFGVTKFSDLSEEEFAKYYLIKNFTARRAKVPKAAPKTDFSNKWTSKQHPRGPDPTNWDWYAQGACTSVYNQGQCGSCWAFSATETIESYNYLSSGNLESLSMEQIVDCDTSDDGCDGGIPENAYQYVENAGGIEPYSDYPYTAEGGNSGTCQFDSSDVAVTVSGYNSINGEDGLYQQASSAGPVSVCVDASQWSNYQGGVLTSCGDNIDHCVQLTGYSNYGSSSAYWIVRNSWGTDWGEEGFIYVAIGEDLCGIGDEASIASAS